MKTYNTLTKMGIVLFALVSALAGYAMSFQVGQEFLWSTPVWLLVGLYFLSSGSFAINQAQEWKLDSKMERTKSRPIPLGKVRPWQAYFLGFIYVVFGSLVLWTLNPMTSALGLATVALYNGVYTLFWKRRWAFAAVPGAIPGAMPVVIGYSVNHDNIFSPECIYLFTIMFLWQMPHFWCLAIRFKEDYAKGGFPVLPAQLGISKTLYHIGLYVFAYVGVAVSSPWFLKANVLYALLVLPICVKLIFEFFKYFREGGRDSWLPFFLWVNMSMLIFIGVPVFDKWFYLIAHF